MVGVNIEKLTRKKDFYYYKTLLGSTGQHETHKTRKKQNCGPGQDSTQRIAKEKG
jgi:hypothetical protein